MVLISSEKYWKQKFEIFFCFMGQNGTYHCYFFLNFGNICLIQVYLTLLFKNLITFMYIKNIQYGLLKFKYLIKSQEKYTISIKYYGGLLWLP